MRDGLPADDESPGCGAVASVTAVDPQPIVRLLFRIAGGEATCRFERTTIGLPPVFGVAAVTGIPSMIASPTVHLASVDIVH